MTIDLNVDLGEGGPHDPELTALASSVNIACGGHTGDPTSMQTAITLANQHHTAIGAHPSYYDHPHFGRRELTLSPAELINTLTQQLTTLKSLTKIHHLKLHGALYNQAHRDPVLARTLIDAITPLLPNTLIYTLPHGALFHAAQAAGHTPVAEGFLDRTYQPDGTLTPRSQPHALITDPRQAVTQALQLAHNPTIQTLCIHGDSQEALALLTKVRQTLLAEGFTIHAPGH
ncbi:MAG: LamB/YcsF family protein [Verrucomicrobiota bacterium]